MFSVDQTIALLTRAAAVKGKHRNAQLVHLPASGSLLVAGDLHNHARNYDKFKREAALAKNPDRHVILQELIHGGPLGPAGEDNSLDMLLDALDWSFAFPDQVHFLMANHDWAQVNQLAVMKEGYDLTERFNRGLTRRFGAQAPAVAEALRVFVYAMPLAAISATGILFTHSLPGPRDMEQFDATILQRTLTAADFQRNGPVYKLIWGRFQTPDVFAPLCKAWWVDFFVCGHQQQDSGHGAIPPRMLILDSSHNHGAYLTVQLERQYSLESLAAAVRPFAAIA